jgi:hypothetical protein
MATHDIQLTEVERQFGSPEGKVRFPRFCNAVMLASASGPLPTLPRLDDSPGADGGFDGSWSLPEDAPTQNALPFAQVGWNALQFKAVGCDKPPGKAFEQLRNSVKGAVQAVISRAGRPGELGRYTLFTNLNLGRAEASTTLTRRLESRKASLVTALRHGLAASERVQIEIVSAAELQAFVNARPALRETFFGHRLFETWDEAWATMALQPHTAPDIPFVGRAEPLTALKAKLADPTIGFIGLLGASGMGKTRLGLEATREFAARTFFVRSAVKADFLARRLDAYATPARSIFVVEDLRVEEAKDLAAQVLRYPGLCVIASIPSEEHLPRFGLVESRGVLPLRLAPLGSNEARELLRAAKAKLDSDAFEWVLQEAGGNPQILLGAASKGAELRQKTGSLRRQVAMSFLEKAKALLGPEVEPVLELLSVLSPFDTKNATHVEAVRQVFGFSADSAAIRRIREKLVDAALAENSGRRGHELNVSPPLLAAFLLEMALDGHRERCMALYERLDEDGRRRLLDRLVSVDSTREDGLWAHVFGAKGPFCGRAGVEENQSSLRVLARAAPRQTAVFLRSRAKDWMALLRRKRRRTSESLVRLLSGENGHRQQNQRIQEFRWTMHAVLHELVMHPDSSHAVLALLEQVVVGADEERTFEKLFRECFVPWHYGFPVRPEERWAVIERLTGSADPREQKVGFDALFDASAPPHNLSGQAVERRRIGERVASLTMGEVWDYRARAFERHLATATKPGAHREVANQRLPAAIAELRHLPPARVMTLIRQLETAFWRGRLDMSPAHFLGCLIETRERFEEAWKGYSHTEWAAPIPQANAELGRMMERVENGPVRTRVAIWIDPQRSFGWEQIEGTKRYRYQDELEKLAAEIAALPKLFSSHVVGLLVGDRATHGGEFAEFLGRADRAKCLWPRLAGLQKHRSGAWVFGCYCDGVREHDAAFVEEALERAMANAGADMTMVLKKMGPTPSNRRRLLELVRRKRVTSAELVAMFSSGRWLGSVPVGEVKSLLAYIAKDESPMTNYGLLQVFNLYLHQTKTLPTSLLRLAEKVLLRPAHHAHDTSYDSDELAERILDTSEVVGVKLFQRLMKAAVSPQRDQRGWNPVNGFSGAMDFYERVRTLRPKMAYQAVFLYLESTCRVDVWSGDSSPFDLEKHADVLLKLTKGDTERAVAVAANVRRGQAGFWPFVYSLLAQHPAETRLRKTLASIFTHDLRWGVSEGGPGEASLMAVEQELAQSFMPSHGRAFLDEVRAELTKWEETERDEEQD